MFIKIFKKYKFFIKQIVFAIKTFKLIVSAKFIEDAVKKCISSDSGKNTKPSAKDVFGLASIIREKIGLISRCVNELLDNNNLLA